jgi:hypothetical protein
MPTRTKSEYFCVSYNQFLRGRHGHLLVKWESQDLGDKLGRALELFPSGEFLSLGQPERKRFVKGFMDSLGRLYPNSQGLEAKVVKVPYLEH